MELNEDGDVNNTGDTVVDLDDEDKRLEVVEVEVEVDEAAVDEDEEIVDAFVDDVVNAVDEDEEVEPIDLDEVELEVDIFVGSGCKIFQLLPCFLLPGTRNGWKAFMSRLCSNKAPKT